MLNSRTAEIALNKSRGTDKGSFTRSKSERKSEIFFDLCHCSI